jgi:S1-C subfamily serine protease
MKLLNKFTLAVLAVIIATGCASILNSKVQKVQAVTNTAQTKVFVDDEEISGSRNLVLPMKRDLNTRQIRVERAGYKTEYYVAFQESKSPLYFLSVVPFGILLYPIFYDMGPKAFNYGKGPHEYVVKRELTTRGEKQKYVFLNKTSLNVPKDDFRISEIPFSKYKSGVREGKRSTSADEDVEIENSIFSDVLNELLAENDFADTTESFFKSKTNTMYVSSNVNSLDILRVRHIKASQYAGNFIEIEVSTTWKLEDVYKVEVYSTDITARSGQISLDFNNDEAIKLALQDAITNAFLDFLEDPEFVKFTELKDLKDEITFTEMDLAKPKKLAKSLNEAMEATVTVITDDGHGSGFAINNEGYIITNHHVVAGKEKVKVRLNNKKEYDAVVVRNNPYFDVALLKVDLAFTYALALPTARNIDLGGEVFAIGTPASIQLGQSLSKGVVSAMREEGDLEFIQTDVSINAGNSGGPIVTKDGKVLGVVNSKLVGFGLEGIAFGIPAEKVNEFLKLNYR